MPQPDSSDALGFLADGQERACDAIRQKITEKYASELKQASFWQLWKLHWRIEREVHAELEKVAPDRGLYLGS